MSEVIINPAPFEITDVHTERIASNGQASLQIHLPEGGRVFRRRAVKLNKADGTSSQVEWAVAELDGVRAYFDGTHVVVTRRDLNP